MGDSGIYTYLLFIFRTDTTVSVLKFVDFVSEGFKVYLSQGEKNEKTSCEFQKSAKSFKNRFQNSQKHCSIPRSSRWNPTLMGFDLGTLFPVAGAAVGGYFGGLPALLLVVLSVV